ncbi:branched-chain amino acid ABC transporter permease [Planotetraspora mira]|uniref:Branched-chain amino acid ABC transporter permease n=1 Tax=Planotetraspora mira TaxID=58121 RepID=A0A8J3TNM5_9ACTN|nr:branched-chain amino acid ABC transporter permease [Planotetraspora mira]GII29162.1 branched-chain amino acid ABC transporter permease [Planotetraspora mira]
MNLLQQVLDGLSSGSVYATLALALVLVHRSTGIVNFAQGQMAVISTYVAWTLYDAGVPVWGAIGAAIVLSLVVGALVERFLIRRFEGGEPLAAIVVTVGLLISVNGLVSLIWGTVLKQFPSAFPSGGVGSGSGGTIGYGTLGTIGALLVVVLALNWLFRHTRLGLAFRAVAANPESSALLGLPVGRLLMLGWGLAAAVGALAGCLVAPKLYLAPEMMDSVLTYALAAAVLGGLNSALGTVLAAWFIGVVENLAGTYVSFVGGDMKIAVPLVLMVLILLLKPEGVFGHKEVRRV